MFRRPPTLPERESIPEGERDAYDGLISDLEKLGSRPIEKNPYAAAVLNAPPFAAALWKSSLTIVTIPEREGNSFSHLDREYINFVLGFDTGHYEVLAWHLEWAVYSAGMSLDTIEALWEGRDDDLPPDERQLVDYIRAVVDGKVTDKMWEAMCDRFGERGAIEYTMAIAYIMLVNRLTMAFGTPTMSRQEMEETLKKLRAGEIEVPDYEEHDKLLQELAQAPGGP